MTEKISTSNSANTSSPVLASNEFAIAVRDLNAPNHLRFVQSEDFRINEGKRKLIIFPGGLTLTPEKGNGMCKLTEREFFPQLFEDNHKQQQSSKERLQSEKDRYMAQVLRDQYEICVMIYHNRNRALQAQLFFDQFIVPMIAQKNSAGELQRIDAQKAAENMQYFTASTHCYGSYLVKEIDSALGEMLTTLGYTSQESRLIASQGVVFNHNNIDENIGVIPSHWTHIHRIPLKDDTLKYEECRPGSYQRFIKGEKYVFSGPCIDVLSDSEISFLTPDVEIQDTNEHQSYWLPSAQLSENGRTEHRAFTLLASDILENREISQSLEKRLSLISGKHRKYAPMLKKLRANGALHMDKFAKYCRQVALVASMSAGDRYLR